MTQKTLSILGTVCALSLVLLGLIAGCKKKEGKEETSSEKTDATKEQSSGEEKKDINLSSIQEKSEEANKDSGELKKEVKSTMKEEESDNKEEKSKEKEDNKKEKKEESKLKDKKDQKRVALVEKTLKNMAVALSDPKGKPMSVEDDVLLA